MECLRGFSTLALVTLLVAAVAITKADLSCNVTAVSSVLTVDLVLLHIAEDDFPCLFHLDYVIGAFAITGNNDVVKGLVVDIAVNSSRLFILPLTTSVVNIPSENNSTWIIEEGYCWLHLKPLHGFEGTIHEIDVHDHLVLKAELQVYDSGQHIAQAISLLPNHFWFIRVQFEYPGIFIHRVDWEPTLTGRNISIHIWQKDSNPIVSNVTVSWMLKPQSRCSHSKLTATIRSGCPSMKRFRFIYPEDYESQLVKLPTNYRPPSHHGSSIPTSPHIYNADPNKSIMKTQFKVSQNAAFKQCHDKMSREECECTEAMKASQDIDFSDCISRVYRQPYQRTFQLEFTISLGNGIEEEVRNPINIVEVNGRTSFSIRGLSNGYVQPGTSTSIMFQASELFHFEAKLVNSSSFCNLTTHIAVYVDRVPLLRAAEYSIIVSSTIVFEAIIVGMYLLHHFKQIAV